MTTSFASVEDGTSFVRRTELLCVVPHFFLSTLLARLLDNGRRLHVLFRQSLDIGAFISERRRKGVWFRFGGNSLGRSVCINLVNITVLFSVAAIRQTFALCAADIASQCRLLQTTAAVEQIAAVGAKNKSSNGGHFEVSCE